VTTTYTVRTHPHAVEPSDSDVRLLDWRPGASAATIQIGAGGARFFDGWRPPADAVDLLLLGAAAYCADKTALRRASKDCWTREIALELPVRDPEAWHTADWAAVLNFLTGDRWTITASHSDADPLTAIAAVPDTQTSIGDIDAVCLFSGGLDSLAGVIDLLETQTATRICLLSHNEGGQASTTQDTLIALLTEHFGPDRLIGQRLYLRPAPANAHQLRPLPPARENTTRARSLLFLTVALALAASVDSQTPVYIPENGFIGINVPLTRARVGSYSTRTTHPHFIKEFDRAAAAIGVSNQIRNPYRLQTKGELLCGSRNLELLARLAPLSLSCSHPEAARYVQRPQGNCGYCFPCLIRRAAMAQAGWDDPAGYAWDALNGRGLLDRRTRRGADLRAVIAGVYTQRRDSEVLRNGPIPDGEHSAFIGVWRRGLAELRQWLAEATEHTAELVEQSR
jgi:7-cyano-7-deazaguanine synthase in queuosine biosynthesis